MKKKLFITGGGYADIPIIKAAKELGFFVITGGLDEKGLGNFYSDQYCRADNSDKEAVLAVAKELKVDAICPSAAGLSSLSSSYASEQLGFKNLDSYAVANTLHSKDSFQKIAKANNVPSPISESFDDVNVAIEAVERFCYPVIVKPVDLSGGKGIIRVNDREEAIVAITNAFDRSKSRMIIVEKFIDGSNHGFSTIIKDDKVVFYFCDNEYYYLNKYTVAGTSTPGDVPKAAINVLISEIEKISSLLKLKDGIFHLQFILKGDKPYIIDICRRIPGDLYVDFVKYATGLDYPAFIVRAFTGMDLVGLEQKQPDGYYTRHVIMGNKNGRFGRVIIDDLLKENIIDKFMIFKKGDFITDFMTQRLGIVFFKFGSKEEMDDKNKRIHQLIKVEGEEHKC